MEWVIGPDTANSTCRFEVPTDNGQVKRAAVEVLRADGLPSPGRRKRLLYVGDFRHGPQLATRATCTRSAPAKCVLGQFAHSFS